MGSMRRRATLKSGVVLAFVFVVLAVSVSASTARSSATGNDGSRFQPADSSFHAEVPAAVGQTSTLPLSRTSLRESVAGAGSSRSSKDKPKPPKHNDPPPAPEPPPPPPAPGAPTALACVSGDTEDAITFTPGSGGPVAEFALFRSENVDGEYSQVATVAPDATSIAVAIAEPTYAYYRILARGPGGESAPSETLRNDAVVIAETVGPEGATLRASNGEMSLALAPGSYATTTTVTVTEVDGSPRGGLIALAGVYEISPSGPLGAPATLSVAYTTSIEHFQVREAVLSQAKLMTYDAASGIWSDSGSAVTSDSTYLSGTLSHFSYWTAATVQPHGTSSTLYCADGGICHNLSTYPNSATRIAARSSAVCYNCHGNVAAAGATIASPDVQSEFGLTGSKHPVIPGAFTGVSGSGLYCVICHDPHADPTASPGLLKAKDAATGTYVQGGGNTAPGTAFCWTCHGAVNNKLVNYYQPGYFLRTGGDRKTGYDPGDLGVGGAGGSCTVCHAAHGSERRGLLVDQIGPFTVSGLPRHAGADHTVAGPCVSAPCHTSDAAVIHAAIGCDACHGGAQPVSFACRECHEADVAHAGIVSAPNHGQTEKCVSCHTTGSIMGAHGDDCGKCHPTPATTGTVYTTCSQTGCHPAATLHQSIPGYPTAQHSYHNSGQDCWQSNCHPQEETSRPCTDCHSRPYERVAPATTSDAKASYTAAAVIRLTAADSGAGVREIYYQIDGGALQVGTLDDSVLTVVVLGPTSGTKAHTIEFWSRDRHYNTEGHHFAHFAIVAGADTAPPAGTMSLNAGAVYATTANVTVGSSVSDAVTGVVRMSIDPGTGAFGAWTDYAPSAQITVPSGNGVKTVRVKYQDAFSNELLLTDTIHLDGAAPTGSILINNNAATTTTNAVTLNLTAADTGGSGVAQMRFQNGGGAWSSWETYAATKSWTLVPGNGAKTVNAQFSDVAGNLSAVYPDSITLDAPTATLAFRGYVYGESSGWADVQVENGSGQVLYSAHIIAYGGAMSWDCVVPSGASYRMVCTGGYDGYESASFGGSSYPTPVVTKDQVVQWTFYDMR